MRKFNLLKMEMAIKIPVGMGTSVSIRSLLLMVLILILMFSYYVYTEKSLDKVNEKCIISYQFVNDLQDFSDEKTRMVRAFVVNRDVSYQKRFQESVDIHSGKRTNPKYKNKMYYDAASDEILPMSSTPVSLMVLLKINGYSSNEIGHFQQAELLVNVLTQIELSAVSIAADHGTFDTEWLHALESLFDSFYMDTKDAITKEVDIASTLLHRRMEAEVKAAEKLAFFARIGVVVSGGVFLLLIVRLFMSWMINEKYQELYRKLVVTQSKLNAFMDYSPAIIWIKRDNGRFDFVNKMFEKRFGVIFQDWKNKTDEELWPANIAKRLRENDLKVLESEETLMIEEEVVDANQFESVWQVTKFMFKDETGNRFVAGIGMDITELRKMRIELMETRSNLQLLIDHAPAALAMFDRNMCYMAVSKRWLQDYLLQDADLIGRSHYEIFPEVKDNWRYFHYRGLSGEILHQDEELFIHANGSQQWITWEIRPWYTSAGGIGGIVFFSTDVTSLVQARKAMEAINEQLEDEKRKFQYLSCHDHLTGLYNRALMNEFLKSEFSLVKRNQRHVCLMMVDIDFFKKLNDNFGHAVGDMVLAYVARVIKERLRDTDIAIRYGGEAFLILLPDSQIDQVATLAKDINHLISKTPLPCLNNGYVTVSIGVTRIDESDDTYLAAVLRADAALYRSKESNRNCFTVLIDSSPS